MTRDEIVALLEDIALNSTSEIAKVRAISMLLGLKDEAPPENQFDEFDEVDRKVGVSRLYEVRPRRTDGA
jgi:hypothetical protein